MFPTGSIISAALKTAIVGLLRRLVMQGSPVGGDRQAGVDTTVMLSRVGGLERQAKGAIFRRNSPMACW